MTALRIVIDVLIGIGAIFALAGTIGILKMPDAFSRMQASTCIPTLGTICPLLGALLYAIFFKNGDVASAVADDGYNGGVLVLIAKAANSANTDPVGKRITITDYTKSGTVIAKASGGTPSAGDKYELYPAVGSTICGLDSGRQNLVVSATGASALRVIGHDYDRHMIRCMAVKHALASST